MAETFKIPPLQGTTTYTHRRLPSSMQNMAITLEDDPIMSDNYEAPFAHRGSATSAGGAGTAYRDFSNTAAAASSSLRERATSLYGRAQNAAYGLAAKAWDVYYSLSLAKRVLLLMVGTGAVCAGVLFLVFHEKIFQLLVEFAHAWKQLRAGPYIMFLLITVISFPPLIGYSTLGSLCGMMYGFPGGWPLLTAGTLFGSTVSFLTFRYLLSGFAARLAQSNRKFAALTKTMERDNFTLLWMIRLCPLPYSLSNGALASIPSVTPKAFVLATAVTSPKLLIHVFIGDRIARLGTEKDTATKIVDVLSILIAGVFAAATAYTIYMRTVERAEHLDGHGYDNLELGHEEEEENFIDDELLNDSDEGDDRALPRRNL